MNIVFFGTPVFAANNLEHLYNNGKNIISVITLPSTKKGRGRKKICSPVKEKATELNIKVLTPKKLTEKKLIKYLVLLKPDLFIVVAFRKLPKEIWKIPKIGTINLHASFLPNYRGAAPINRVLINGEKETGITTFFINEKIDTGNILLQERVSLSRNTTAAQLYNLLMRKGSKLLLETINKISTKDISSKLQNEKRATNAPKINKEITKINWLESAINIHNLIRGLSPVINKDKELKNVEICPGAWFLLEMSKEKKIRCKILLSRFSKEQNKKERIIETDNKSFFKINLPDGGIFIEKIQLAGKRSMTIENFLKGYKINENWKIL